jgi:hypothetical protein
VIVPPTILDNQSTQSVSVSEGQRAQLVCIAKGNPEPSIEWRRPKLKSCKPFPLPKFSNQSLRIFFEHFAEFIQSHHIFFAYGPDITYDFIFGLNLTPFRKKPRLFEASCEKLLLISYFPKYSA